MYMQYWKNWQKKMEVLFLFSGKCQDHNLHVPYVLLTSAIFVLFYHDVAHQGVYL